MSTGWAAKLTDALYGCKGRDRAPEVVLLLRVIAFTWLLTGHALLLPTRSVPFFQGLLPLAQAPLIGWAELLIGSVCAIQLALGRSVRASALTLGLLILLTTLLSRAFFSNNRLYTACVLVMVALEPDGRNPRLLRAQVGLMYLAAGLDKLLDTDWRSGVFLDAFTRDLAAYGRLWSPAGDAGTPYLPATLVGSLVEAVPSAALAGSYGVIALEIGLGALFLARRYRAAIALGVTFHLGLLLVTGSPMGMYFYAATAAYLGFVRLPDRVMLRVGPNAHRVVSVLLSHLDPDGRLVLERGAQWSVAADSSERSGLFALATLLTHLPAFYVALAVLLAAPWFSPWLVVCLAPLALGLGPLPRPRPKVVDVAS